MKKTKEELNDAAMQIILHAGNCRNIMKEALMEEEQDGDRKIIADKMKQAKTEITKAHRIQTDMIQSTIEEDDMQTTLLFTHAQDTLMTINAELDLAEHLIRLVQKISSRYQNEF